MPKPRPEAPHAPRSRRTPLAPPSTVDTRHAAAQGAAEHADDLSPSWTERAIALVVDYAANAAGGFLIEEVRLYAKAREFPEPPEPRAWGAVASTANRRGLIRTRGYAAAHDGSPKTLWIRS